MVESVTGPQELGINFPPLRSVELSLIPANPMGPHVSCRLVSSTTIGRSDSRDLGRMTSVKFVVRTLVTPPWPRLGLLSVESQRSHSWTGLFLRGGGRTLASARALAKLRVLYILGSPAPNTTPNVSLGVLRRYAELPSQYHLIYRSTLPVGP